MAIFDFLKEIPLSAVLREKLKDIEAELATLMEANAKLVSQSAKKDATIAKLSAQLRGAHSPQLEDAQITVLKVLAAHRPNQEVTEAAVAAGAGIGVQSAVYHLEKLHALKLVDSHHYAGLASMGIDSETHWSLASRGREFLAKNGLLN